MRSCMLRCRTQHKYLRVSRQATLRAARWAGGNERTLASAHFATTTHETSEDHNTSATWHLNPRQTTPRVRIPAQDERHEPQAWLDLLDNCLPTDLREHSNRNHPPQDIADTAQLLLAAQRQTKPVNGIDLLFVLAHGKERWAAVIWLVKRLVEAYGAKALQPSRLQQTVGLWSMDGRFDDLSIEKGFQNLTIARTEPTPSSAGHATLDQLTNDAAENLSQDEVFAHRTLGQIWSSLGRMTLACAETEMKPEILEIIAYLHHMGIMPASIYNQKPSMDVTSIQQPPTLNLLSSRMLVSLSDAAWRAHERELAEESNKQRDRYKPSPPRSRYRVNVAGLRPEVWLELLLWSCLHGGWIQPGTEILRSLYNEKANTQWKPFSWRTFMSGSDTGHLDWDKLQYVFNTRRPSSMDPPDDVPETSIHKTVSSEVINAYVDALASSTRLGVGARGLSLGYVVDQLLMMRKFLDRGNMSLVTGSWDAILLRLADVHDHVMDQSIGFLQFVKLSPTMGAELESSVRPPVPEYVFDGSAAVIGLYHRAIRSRVKAGDVAGAFSLFQALQDRADLNKRRSMSDFWATQQPAKDDDAANFGLFTSNFSGIAYPAFDMEIPTAVLGPFLNLVIDAKALRFARWLLYSTEVDGPVIPERLYTDPAIAPVLIRLASETNNKSLLAKVVNARKAISKDGGPALPQEYIRSFFQSQVERKNWGGAAQVLQHMEVTPDKSWSIMNIAYVARAMLLEHKAVLAGDSTAEKNLNQVQRLFRDVLKAVGNTRRVRLRFNVLQQQTAVILLIFSGTNAYWAEYCNDLLPRKRYFSFDLPTDAFNLLLEGVARSYGFATGRQVFDSFSPGGETSMHHLGRSVASIRSGESMPKLATDRPATNERIRSTITIPTDPSQTVVMYGTLRPNIQTIRILLRQALEEYRSCGQSLLDADAIIAEASSTPAPVLWAVGNLRRMDVPETAILNEINAFLFRPENTQSLDSGIDGIRA